MHHKQLFWLHVKKSAGMTTRALLQPYYVEVNRVKKPKTFIQAEPEEYNDILNNYRVVLGDYQFRRCLFAREYLYPNQWDDIFSFAFSREPIDRCVSMFFYLFWEDLGRKRYLMQLSSRSIKSRKLMLSASYAFDVFLDNVYEARQSDSIYHPLGLHFATHTAPMWDDITDFDGNVLLKKVFRLEYLNEGINKAFENCGIDKRLDQPTGKLDKTREKTLFSPTEAQIRKIEEIYPRDFDVYETAEH